MSDTRGAILAAALVGGLVFLAPSKPVPLGENDRIVVTTHESVSPEGKRKRWTSSERITVTPKQSTPSVKTPVQKTSAPSQRTTPIPRPRPPAAISRPERKAVKKQQKRVAGLPSCSAVRAQYDSMSLAQRWSAYQSATSEQVAHGRRCLGI
jgi:hypothetical protein